MAAHRYWRADQIAPYGLGALELSEFHLLASGSRVDAGSTLTASSAPTSGSLADLQDADALTTANWASATGLALTWDLGGSPADVDDIRLTSTVHWVRFPNRIRIRYSDDGSTWTTWTTFRGIEWPGVRTATGSVSRLLDDGVTSGTFITVNVAREVGTDDLEFIPTIANVGPVVVYPMPPMDTSRKDYTFVVLGQGRGRIQYTVKDKITPPPNAPVRERVRLYRQKDGVLVGETWSDATTGVYTFDNIDETQLHYVIAFDKEGAYRAVVADRLLPDLMP